MSINITVNGVAYTVPSSAADTNWAAQQVAFLQALAAALAPPTWLAPSLVNSWADIGAGQHAAGYCKDSNGNVFLRGTIHAGASGTTALTLPSGYRPTAGLGFPIWCAGNACGVVSISMAGVVTISNLTAGANVGAAASLDGISFSTAA